MSDRTIPAGLFSRPLVTVPGCVQDAVDALTFMAEFCLRKRKLQDAEMYAMRLQDFGGPAKDKGRRVIDEVQKLKFQPDSSHALGMHTDV